MQPRLVSVDDLLNLESPAPDFRIAYGDEPLQFGELRLPRGEGPHPVAIVIHGGCWRSQYDIGHIRSFSDALRNAGIATWALEYRRVGDPGGGWPGTFLDVARGADHLRAVASDHGLDLERVVAVGHSAGGHLALWLAGRDKLSGESPLRSGERPISLQGVVALAGVDDLGRALREGICDDMVARLMGGRPEDVESRYRDASPIELLPLGVSQHHVAGALDPIVPAAFARDFAGKARAAGDDARLTVLEDAGHFELVVPSTNAFQTVLRAVKSVVGSDGS